MYTYTHIHILQISLQRTLCNNFVQIDEWRSLRNISGIVTQSLNLAERLVDASYNRSAQNMSLFPSEIQTMNTYTSVLVECVKMSMYILTIRTYMLIHECLEH